MSQLLVDFIDSDDNIECILSDDCLSICCCCIVCSCIISSIVSPISSSTGVVFSLLTVAGKGGGPPNNDDDLAGVINVGRGNTQQHIQHVLTWTW